MRGTRRTTATIVAAALALSTVTACRDTKVADPVHGLRAAHQYVLPDPYIVGDIAVGAHGTWISANALQNLGTSRPAGALGHIDEHGQLAMIPMPTLNSYPGAVVVDREGTVWYGLAQGTGVRPTVDSGPALANREGQVGWRTRDGAFHHVRLSRQDDLAGWLAADPAGGVWFTVATTPRAFGHVAPDGTRTDYTLPAPGGPCPTTCPTDSTEIPSGAYLEGIQPGPDDTVWLTFLPGCRILQVSIPDVRVLHRFAGNRDANSMRAECASAASTPGRGVAVPLVDGVATARADGTFATRTLPIATPSPAGSMPEPPPSVQRLAVDPAGRTWALVTDEFHGVTPSTVYLMDEHGQVQTFHPIGDPGPAPSRISTDRSAVARFDVECRSIMLGTDGNLWLAGSLSVWQVAIG